MACGNSFSIALTQQGTVYAWGIGKSGSLGLGESSAVEQYPHLLSFSDRNDDTLNITDPEKSKTMVKSDFITAISSG